MNKTALCSIAAAAIAMLVTGAATAAADGKLVSLKDNKALYAGYTAVGKAPSGRLFRIYYSADGKVKYVDSKGGKQKGTWRLTGKNMLCYDWKKWRDRCYTHRKEGKFYRSYRDGKTKGSKFKLVKGDIGLK
ncbi:MAG: hypothetical protein CFH40_01363 [Alphaproteobacteria bacterium MarineAlpha10_Bin3]|nr:MAG: hypothetical protein CFH40_01363 [Alphaproteobacteria bacterium MarineAlpha10_Bin3]PPR70864.1 MAG: hypothetical protein CFH09_01363 [Alphaproteobacteria bacterium MarineAlpha4_Bin1]